MSLKVLYVVGCAVLLVTFFNTVHAQVCVSTKTNAFECADCDDFCGSSLKNSSCCSSGQIGLLKYMDNAYIMMGASAKCREYLGFLGCGPCSPYLQQYVDPITGSTTICKSFCLEVKKECDNIAIANGGQGYNCTTFPETNCYNSFVGQVSTSTQPKTNSSKQVGSSTCNDNNCYSSGIINKIYLVLVIFSLILTLLLL